MKRMGGIRGSWDLRRETEKTHKDARERRREIELVGWGRWRRNGGGRGGSPERHLGRHHSNYPREYKALHHTRCK